MRSFVFRGGGLFALGFAPLLLVFFCNLWRREPYQFFPLALTGAGFLAWWRFREAPRPFVGGPGFISLPLWALSFVLLAAATVIWSPWLGAIAALVAAAAWAWWRGGWTLFRAMIPAGLLLLTIIPPPLNLDVRLTLLLRQVAVTWSSKALDMLGVVHSQSGNVIEIPGRRLLVEEACSGINSVLFISAACLFYLLWRRRSAVQILVSLPLAVGFVVLGNVLRITLGAWLGRHYQVDILSGWRHELVGLLLFTGYLGLILSLDQLCVFFAESPRRGPPAVPATPGPVAALEFNVPNLRAWATGVAVAFGLLGVAQIGHGVLRSAKADPAEAVIVSRLRENASFVMPARIGEWERVEGEVPTLQKVETLGVCSQIWHYQHGNTVASVALDYPFRGYHDVRICYRGQGWDLFRSATLASGEGDGRIPRVEVEMKKGSLRYGSLWFSTVDEMGRWHEGPDAKLLMDVRERFAGELAQLTTYRVQVLVTGYQPATSATREKAGKLFADARTLLADQLLGQMKPQ